MDTGEHIALSDSSLIDADAIDFGRLRGVVEQQRGMREAFACLEEDPSIPPQVLREYHRDAPDADWADSTTLSVEKYIRAWARTYGIPTRLRARVVR